MKSIVAAFTPNEVFWNLQYFDRNARGFTVVGEDVFAAKPSWNIIVAFG